MPSTTLSENFTAQFAADVRAGLTREGQKILPAKYLYDELGSTLFEAITLLPEYGAARADQRLLKRYSPAIVEKLSTPVVVAELGAGSGKKARWVLEELTQEQHTTYYPIDISAAALTFCENDLGKIDKVSVQSIQSTFQDGLQEVVKRRTDGHPLLVLFLGSTIGNFRREDIPGYLRDVRASLNAGDSLLLSTDLVKPLAQLLPAYNDAIGLTAAFNLNVLTRINRELGADFDLSKFEHFAPYNQKERRIEMHLRSLEDQTVAIAKAETTVNLRRDETIWTESSHKFTPEEVVALGEATGFRCEAQWLDEEWPFAQSLLVAV